METDTIAIRAATADDEAALRRLAALDDRPVPARPALVAEAGGVLVAALQIDYGRSVADPFQPSAHVVELLRLRARQLESHTVTKAPRRALLARLRPQPRALA